MIIFYFCKISFPTKLENMNNLPIELKMLMADILTCRQLVRLSLTSMNWNHITKVISLRRANAHLSCLHIKKFNPDLVIGMGGFVSGPGGVAARLAKKPLIIHEQNAIAGMTNRLLSKYASVVLQGFPNAFPSAI